MRRIHIILIALFAAVSLYAQDNTQPQQRFSPEAFDAAMQAVGVDKAALATAIADGATAALAACRWINEHR